MFRAVFSFVLSASLFPAAAAALDIRVHGLDTPAPVAWVGRLDGSAAIRLEDGSHHTVGLDEQGVILTPRPEPLPAAHSGDPDPMPDEAVTRGAANIRAAWYRLPTDRYAHGALGDAIEAGGLALRTRRGRVERLTLRTEAVFEDIAPRLVDLDGDGLLEVLAVKSYLEAGAALAVIETSDRGLRTAAESEPIGQANRWLNPVGVADFDGDGRPEAAAVITPHIGGTLRLYEWRDEKLVPDGEAAGFSNHVIGSRELGLAAVADMNGDGVPDIVLPDAARTALRLVTFAKGRARELALAALEAPVTLAVVAADLNGDGRAEIVLAPGGKLTVIEAVPQ